MEKKSALLVPEDEDEAEAFRAIVRSLETNYPSEWETWKVTDYSYEELFGKEISSSLDRFGIPSTDLVRAFYQDAKDLSEIAYRNLRRILINWPLGRALIYSPHAVASKVHDFSYHEFMSTIRELKAQGKLTNRDKTSKILRNESGQQQSAISACSTPLSREVTDKNSSDLDVRASAAAKRQSEERGASPPPKRQRGVDFRDQGSSNHLLVEVFQKQMEMFSKILEMQSEQNNNIKQLQAATKPTDLNASIDSTPDSTRRGDARQNCSRSPIVDFANEDSDEDSDLEPTDNAEQAVRNEISCAKRRLEAIKAAKATNNDSATVFDFKPCTTEIESKFSKADPILAQQGTDCQRLGTDTWKNIRYSEVQKQFQATPTFSALKVNNLFVGITPNWTSIALLEKMDLILGAITNGLLQQRKIFEKLPQDFKQRVGQEFLASNSKFRKNSDALLQYVSGRRAEVLQLRRDTYKVKNKALHEIIHSIPPSDCHLFKEPELTQVVKDQGGLQKFFPFKKTFL
ncbi:Uncharacterized protein OBRU01_17753 [Operophtera brumata]|uniref:Uncharacterized protein n=1 Tax=Operophtera brumata TaxID=104452 RepID=A0A0L7KZG8_OPEBR|nr:Uncharacterized protein OBRU01_17753 [Operophtera brumata]